MEVGKEMFFHLFDLVILNTYILFSSCGGKKISHRDFRLTLMRNLLAQAGQERNVPRPIGRPLLQLHKSLGLKKVVENIGLFRPTREEGVVYVWPGVSTKKFSVKCQRCDVALCVGKNAF